MNKVASIVIFKLNKAYLLFEKKIKKLRLYKNFCTTHIIEHKIL